MRGLCCVFFRVPRRFFEPSQVLGDQSVLKEAILGRIIWPVLLVQGFFNFEEIQQVDDLAQGVFLSIIAS